jgi:hypothetical protein
VAIWLVAVWHVAMKNRKTKPNKQEWTTLLQPTGNNNNQEKNRTSKNRKQN